MRALHVVLLLAAVVAASCRQALDVTRYVRFLDDNGVEHQGDEIEGTKTAREITGNLLTGEYVLTDQVIGIARYLAPLPIEPPVIIAVGINYRGHADETGRPYPDYPTLFTKNPSSLAGAYDDIVQPAVSRPFGSIDYETELAFVVGTDAKDVPVDRALDYIAGYTLSNDVSERTWQHDTEYSGTQFFRGKSFDTFCPTGPALVMAHAVPDPNRLRLEATLQGATFNGVVQNSTTADMIFNVQQILAFISEDTTVKAGTLVLTGTPEGVGTARDPPLYMFPGDVITMSLEIVGTMEQRIVAKAKH